MTTAGPLVVRNSSMTSLQEFRHLEEVNTLGLELVSVNGKLYSVAVYGLCQCGMCRALIRMLQTTTRCWKWATSLRCR